MKKPIIGVTVGTNIKPKNVTPQMYGAKGDGVTDDTEPFKNCLASGYDIVIPKGTYLISDTLSISKRVKAVGCTGAVINFVGDTLFEISTYFNAPFELSDVQINANGNKVLSVTNGKWGASVVLDNVYITDADDSCVDISGGFNVSMNRVNISARGTATGTLLKLGTSVDTAQGFSNMIYMESCVINANKNTNLIECGNSHNIKAVNCTFEGFDRAVIGKATLIGCWFENGKRAVLTTDNVVVISPHFAQVDTWSAPDDSNADIYPDVKQVHKSIYRLPKQSLLESRFRNPLDAMETLFAGGYVNGVYEENMVYSVGTDIAYYNVPINKIWSKSSNSMLIFDVSKFREQHIGAFELKVYYFRVRAGEVVQRNFSHGLIIDGNLTVFETTEMPENSTFSIDYDTTQLRILCGNDEVGSSMGWVELNRLGLNEIPSSGDDTDNNLFDYGKGASDYLDPIGGGDASVAVDASVPTIRCYAPMDGYMAALRKTMYEAKTGTYRFKASFTADLGATAHPRFLLRCYDAAGNIITSGLDGWTYLSYYNSYYVDTDDITFVLPAGAVQFQIGFVFRSNPTANVNLYDIELTVTETGA